MANNKDVKPHFFIKQTSNTEKYTYPHNVIIKTEVPERNRAEHGDNLKSQLHDISTRQEQIIQKDSDLGLESPMGIQVSFSSFPGVEMAIESLADARQNIELLNVRYLDEQVHANIFIPHGKLSVIEKKLEAYLTYKKNKKGGPIDNRKLIDAIQSIREAAIDSLWSDDQALFPDEDEVIWWEVWLPVQEDRSAVTNDFKTLAAQANIQVSENTLEFPERTILLIKTSKAKIASSASLISKISELRKAKETADFFDHLEPTEQTEWTDSLLERTEVSDDNVPYICILDTGVNNGHPLLAPFLDDSNQHVTNPEWLATDDNGHGSGMAGLSIWGDLTSALSGGEPISINHKIESVKVLRQPGDNEGQHLGNITAEGMALPAFESHDRLRVYAMALSAKESMDRGKPSAWSATIDSLACDYLGENLDPKLILLCAGNTGEDLVALTEYPHYNQLQSIHDPGQSWNAITVGAFTQKDRITEDDAKGYEPLALYGALSPYSTTSTTWNTSMPIKPEVVFEGGNVGIDEYSCAGLSSLKLLTTHHQSVRRHYSTFEATSAATALAAKFAASIYSQYPSLWPETVRALMIHSAEWTDAMKKQFEDSGTTEKQRAKNLSRCVGYGVPNIDRAIWSLQNSLTMVIEDELQPFEKRKGKSPSTRDMHVHDLPWPKEILQQLGEEQIELKVTLSYFIEPNPSSRNVSSKYRYPSHQLGFDVKRPTESIEDFKSRMSRAAAQEETGTSTTSDPLWLFGKHRHKGSVHKDIWRGSAAELAERGHIIVYPAMGWWRTRTKLERYDKKARYSLIISIETKQVEIDLYASIDTLIENEMKIEVTNS